MGNVPTAKAAGKIISGGLLPHSNTFDRPVCVPLHCDQNIPMHTPHSVPTQCNPKAKMK